MQLIKLGLLTFGILTNSILAAEVITIAASPVPQAEILNQVKPILKKEGIELKIREFDDYVQPNLLVQQGQLDANFFQHRPYLAQFNEEHGTDLVELAGVHIEPMGIYASSNPKLAAFVASKQLSKLPKGLIVGVPNDTTNEGRALLLLQQHGLIKIKPHITYPTKKDILANPYAIDLRELDPAMLPRALAAKQVDLAVLNANYALEANLNPLKSALFIEDANSPYVNVIAVRANELNLPKMKKLAVAVHSAAIKAFIFKTYQGAIIPAF